jgi:hypothetical protein
VTSMGSLVRNSVVVCCDVSALYQQKFNILIERKYFFLNVIDYILLKEEKCSATDDKKIIII